MITRTDKEIQEQIDDAMDTRGNSKYPAMSYEDGVEAALNWVLGNADEPPMED